MAVNQDMEPRRRAYTTLSMEFVEIGTQGTLLTGSKTAKKIKVKEVEVEEFEQGFGTTPTEDFSQIDFD